MLAHADVRLATTADAAYIAAMSRDYIEYGLPWGWQYEKVAKAIAEPNTNVAVVGPPGAVVAFGIMSYSDDEAHLELFAVRRAHQRKGIGSALLRWLELVAREGGAERILVEARKDNTAGRLFYSEHGYHEREIKQGMYHNMADGIRFEKWLRNNEPPLV